MPFVTRQKPEHALETRRDALMAEVNEAADRLSSAVSRLYGLLPQTPAPGTDVPAGDPLLEVPDLTGVIDLGDGPDR
mgnify:CR=1 FL=1